MHSSQPCLLVTSQDHETIDEEHLELATDVITPEFSSVEIEKRVQSLSRLHTLSVQVGKQQQLAQAASILSHDLRNPLNVAQANLDLAQENKEAEYFDRVDHSLNRIEELIADVSTLARQEYDLGDFATHSLQELAREAWEECTTVACSLNITTDEEVSLRGNRSALKELLTNLYRNAIAHNESPVTITVGAVDNGFYVADDGQGISAGEQDCIFETGYTTRQEGTGLGLSIVEQVVEAHGGEVAVTDSDAGGARFEITGVTVDHPHPQNKQI
ncbi:HAMP domain-containing sensor histidine kinase [Salarchaeum sp. JOR-1]|uniref:sensor histidine kinase n=1 Tax=Salarchaeum sp. JOR-1 TaxID=2599399 RepID=UPI00143E00C3|nr:HAMP domain-containing sensor histidine kinase [Salarchaeum sp. JOR-1]